MRNFHQHNTIPEAGPALPATFRPRDLEALGIPRSRLLTWLKRGTVEQLARGLYQRTDAELGEHETIAGVATRVPRAVVCLLTALRVHDLGTQLPRKVWIAIDRKARKPRVAGLPVHIVRFSGQLLDYAVETREVQGVRYRITSPARTVVDCFRYRNKIGLDVAIEALRDVLAWQRIPVNEILSSAKVCRVHSVIGPYLEALTS
ncbi:MAG: transcriptional regulator [bacterium]|nr:transcriptional regulator [bacterium]